MPSNFECIQSGETACGDINIRNNGHVWLRGRRHSSGLTSCAEFQSMSLLLWTEQSEQGWFAFHLGNWWNSLKYSRSPLVKTGKPKKPPLRAPASCCISRKLFARIEKMDFEVCIVDPLTAMWVQQLAIKKCWPTSPTNDLNERKRQDFVPAPICWVTAAPSPWRIKGTALRSKCSICLIGWNFNAGWFPTSRQKRTKCWTSRSRRMYLENDDVFQRAFHKSCGNKRGNLMEAVCPTNPFTEAVLRGTPRETTWAEQPFLLTQTHAYIYIYI